MKKPTNAVLLAFNLAVLLLALASAVGLGQQVDSSQTKLKTDGGLVGDAVNALSVAVPRATSAPASPVTGALWCDTSFSPCVLKQYTGSTWAAPLANPAIPVQADVLSFPGSPVDGQIFYSKSPPAIWVYDSGTTAWASFPMPMTTSAANIRDTYTAAVITPPGAPTVAASGTAGSMGAGTYSFKVTCRNANGGETNGGTMSPPVTVGASGSVDLSAIPTCGTGGTNRNIYRTKANLQTVGPWFWAANIADNTTTTLNNGPSDATLGTIAMVPEINFSAPLPGAWAVINNSGTTTAGGCGGTARGTLACMTVSSANGWSSSVTTDSATIRGSLDISAYTAGDYTVQYRVRQASVNGDTYLGSYGNVLFAIRNGTADNSTRHYLHLGQLGVVPWLGPPGDGAATSGATGNRVILGIDQRVTVGGNSNTYAGAGNPWPSVTAWPMWVRWVRRGGGVLSYTSSDGVAWQPRFVCTGTSQTNLDCSENSTVFGISGMDHIELSTAYVDTNPRTNEQWIEIDSFTLTVN